MKSIHQIWREMGVRGAYILIVVTLALAVSLLALYRTVHSPLGTVPLTSETKIQVIAREPGVGYDALKFCDDPATKVHRPGLPVPEDAGRLIAERGLEIVNWPGPGSIAAQHYYTDAQGNNKSEPVEMTPKAAECFIKKAKVP